LIRLSKQQFNELSTDVYDELMRRQNTSQSIPEDRFVLTSANQPFLTPKESFHPKRNQARQKLATLPPGRFKELASDVLYEIERRYPMSVDATNNSQYNDEKIPRATSGSTIGSQRSEGQLPYSASRDRFPSNTSSNNLAPPSQESSDKGPVQRTGMQNTIIPNKSTMVEEEGSDEEEEEEPPLQRSGSNKSNPVQKTFQSNTIVPNTSTMVEESADEEDDDVSDERRIPSTLAPSAASTKSMSPPVFKSNAFSNANNVNGTKTRSISPPPMLSKSRAQVEDERLKEEKMAEKMEEYEDKIEALKERIVELQDDLKKAKEEVRMEKAKSPPPVVNRNDHHMREMTDENKRLKEELREQREVCLCGVADSGDE
jgi:hypothetical protein